MGMRLHRRILMILLIFCVAFAMMPLGAAAGMTAYAEETGTETMQPTRTTMLDLTSINEKYMTTDGKETTVNFTTESVTDSAEGWSWDHETKTLTLSGARIVVTEPVLTSIVNGGGYYYGIRLLKEKTTVVLSEGTENVVQSADAVKASSEGNVFASIGMGNLDSNRNPLTVRGNGKLIVKGGNVHYDNSVSSGQRISAGIYLLSDVVVEDHARIEVSGGECKSNGGAAYSRGISCSGMTITDNAQVTLIGGNVSAVNSRESSGISTSRTLIIDGSAILKAYGGDVTKNPGRSNEWSTSMGICAADFKALANASVYAYGGKTYGELAGSSMGVYIHKDRREYSEANLSDNAFLYAEGGDSEGSSYGVKSRKEAEKSIALIVNDNAYIEATGKTIRDEKDRECSGISIKKVEINGGTVVASAEAENEGSNCSIAAISLSPEAPTPTYAENLTPTVTAGITETDAVKIESPNENTYAKRWVKIQTSEPTYAIAATPSEIDFGTAQTGYAQPGQKTVTITNTGNETVELSEAVLQKNSNYTVSGPLESRIAPRRTAEITVQPKDDLAAGEYNETLTILGSNNTSASVKLKFNVIKSGGSSSGGGSYIPVQKPTILAGEGFQTMLSADGTKLTITAAAGYEIQDILLNGASKGSVTQLSGLKTGDKVEIKTAKKAEPAVPGKPTDPTNPSTDESIKNIKEGVENTSITLESKLTKNKKILLSWTKSRGYKVDRFEIYRSVKKNSGYGKKAFFATKNGDVSTYLNTKNLRTGKTYYYKLRGVRTIDDKKYYTQWSNKAWRTVLH